MKSLSLFLFSLVIINGSYAQTNLWQNSGNVGVGTTSPTNALHVKSGNNGITVESLFTNPTLRFITNAGAGYNTLIGSEVLGSGDVGLVFYTGYPSPFARMTINNGGNVGIGTTSPSEKLEVAGTIRSVCDYTGFVIFTDGWAANDYKEVVQVAPANAGASGLYEITISTTRGNIAESSTYIAAIDHANADVWREAGTINDNSYVGRPRSFTVDVNGGYAAPRFRIRALLASAVSGASGADLVVNFKVRSIGQNTAWTPLSASGSGGTVIGFQSMGGMSYNLYMGNPYNGAGALALSANSMGNVGIGTVNPLSNLQVSTRDNSGMMTLGSYVGVAFSVVKAEEGYGLYTGISGTGDAWLQAGRTSSPTAYNINLQASGGNVGIGTTSPTEKLSVKGKIRAQEIIVETTGWSDHVFADSYKLQSLAEVEQHIKTEKHLPGVPSAQEVAEKGVSVGDMQAILLAKIEEITLHQIAQEKEQSALRAEITKLKAENTKLKAQIK